jgi:hypothetical protein
MVATMRRIDQRDMRFRQQADGGRRVGAGEQEQRAGFGDGAEAAGDAHPIGIDGARASTAMPQPAQSRRAISGVTTA